MSWWIVILFNLGFGLLAGCITSQVFNNKGGLYSGGPSHEKKDQLKMIMRVTVASGICGIFWTYFSASSWVLTGLLFGISTTILTFLFLFVPAKWRDFSEKCGVQKKDQKGLRYFRKFVESLQAVEFFVLGAFTLLYGLIFLLTPGLGILWAYLSFHILQ